MVPLDNAAGEADRLRQRFLVWSLAIASSLTTSGMVQLKPSAAWAQEEPAPEEPTAEKKPSDADPAPQKALDRAAFNKLLQASKLAEAANQIDAALKQAPGDPSLSAMNMTLARLLVGRDPALAIERFRLSLNNLLAAETISAADANSLAMAAGYITQLDKDAALDQKLAVLDRVMSKLVAAGNGEFAAATQLTVSTKARLMLSAGKSTETLAMLDKLANDAMASANPGDQASMLSLISMVNTYVALVQPEWPDRAKSLADQVESMVANLLDKEKVVVEDFTPFYTLKAAQIRSLSYSNPAQLEPMLSGLAERFSAFKERLEDRSNRELKTLEKNIAGLRTSMEPAMKREKMVGSLAPAIDAAHFVATDAVSLGDLKGKVVLLDFWAVWCGPCIANFPHLIQWHDEFADKGLVILGATRFYGYRWNEEKGKAERATDVSEEDELAMLPKFRESYDLRHGFFVSPKNSDLSKQYGVSGIPQAVLIDQEGKIAMIRVGAGSESVQALYEKIAELLK